MELDEIVYGFIKVANETMARPIRALTEARGYATGKHMYELLLTPSPCASRAHCVQIGELWRRGRTACLRDRGVVRYQDDSNPPLLLDPICIRTRACGPVRRLSSLFLSPPSLLTPACTRAVHTKFKNPPHRSTARPPHPNYAPVSTLYPLKSLPSSKTKDSSPLGAGSTGC